MELTGVASFLTLVILVAREIRTGLGSTQDRLIDTLNKTIVAQEKRISLLEQSLKTSDDKCSRLEGEIEDLRDTVERQAGEITKLQRRRGGAQ